MANMPYVLWVAAFNNTQVLLFCLLETVFFPSVHRATDKSSEEQWNTFATSRIMRAFNKNGLAVFLLANLLTGAVNLGMNTLDTGTGMAMAVLIGYAGVLSAAALLLDHWNVKLKL